MLEALDHRPALAPASDFTVTPWLVTPADLCPAFPLWCPGGLVVHSVAHRNELGAWTLPGSFLSPSRCPTQWSLHGCLWNAWGGYLKLCAVCTHTHTHTLPPPSPSLSSSVQLESLSFVSCVSSFLLVLLGDLVYVPGRHCTVLYVSCLTDSPQTPYEVDDSIRLPFYR